MKFTLTTKPLIFIDWNQAGAIELDTTVDTVLTIKFVTEFHSGVLTLKVEEAQRFAGLLNPLATKETSSSVKVTGEADCFIEAQQTNDGDPYREGIRFTIGVEENWQDQIIIDLEYYKAREFAKALSEQATAVGAGEPNGLTRGN